MTDVQSNTIEWYKNYTLRKGENRNNILKNNQVLFQELAFRKSIIRTLNRIPIDYYWKILDVGSASGGSLSKFIEFGFRQENLYGIDIRQDRIEEGKNRFPGINFIHSDASCMNFNSDFFDMVFESTMFMQITDRDLSQEIADEMIRVVHPCGYIMLIDWRYSFGSKVYEALSKKRIAKLFHVGSSTRICSREYGALIPPLGRFISSHFSPVYFLIQFSFPFLVGQVTTVLQKE